MKKIVSVVFFLLMILCVSAQSKLSPITRNYLSGKAQSDDQTESKLFKVSKIDQTDYVSAFVHFTDEVDLSLLESYGVKVESIFSDIVIALIPSDVLVDLSEETAIRYIEMSTPVFPRMEMARGLSNVNAVHEGQAPLMRSYTGKDVVVGVVDYGFQYNHINFYDAQGNLRVKRVWNQNSTMGTSPENFYGGSEYSTPSIIESQGYDSRSDAIGHGTHVSGIAAGSDKNNGNPNYGVAYESDLVFVSYGQRSGTTDMLNGVKYIFDYATKVGKPAVANLSLGSHVGPHDGTSTFDRLSDEIQGRGRIMVGAGGNEGGDRFHVSKVFSSTDTVLKTFVQYNTSYKIAMIDIWGSVGTDYTVQLVLYDKSARTTVDSSAVYHANQVNTANIRFTGVAGSIALGSSLNYTNNKANTTINYQLSSIPDSYVIGIVLKADSGSVDAWTDDYYSWLSSLYYQGCTMGNDVSSVGEIGGTGKRIITVGAYTSNARRSYGQKMNDIANFSSKGPTADGRIKPDITGPGTVLISSVPDLTNVLNSSSYDAAFVNTVNNKKYYYGYMQGTSMSSPYVAGVIALWLQGDSTLTPEDIRSIFAETSLRDSFTGNDLPNNTWGYGKIDAYTGMASVVSRATGVGAPSVDDETAIVYPNPTSGEFRLAFLQEAAQVRMEVIDLTGHQVLTEVFSSVDRGEVHLFDLSAFADGVYMVRISSDRGVQTHRLIVNK